MNTARMLRRTLLGGLTVAAAALAWWAFGQYGLGLAGASRISGWILFALFVLLLAFNLRKKLSFLPLGSAYAWAQLHAYGGLLTGWVFLLHLDGLPDGGFESLFALLFAVALLSGVAGLYISRAIPPQLCRNSETVIYERIPALRQQLSSEAETLVAEHVRAHGPGPVADFYRDRLLDYLAGPTDRSAHLIKPDQVGTRWAQAFDGLRDKAPAQARGVIDELERLVQAKTGLDLQHARRGLLKGWLFLHIPLSYGLLFLVLLHVLLIYGYGGPTA